MNPLSSSIFSSERLTSPIWRALWVVVWMVVWLIAADLSINWLFAFPQNPKSTSVSTIRLYFDYGRSMEAKLARMTRADRSETAPITLAGWYEPLRVEEPKGGPPEHTVTFYGMSHAVQLAFALGRTSNRFAARIVGGPGATANWAYGAYLRDRGGGRSRAVVLGLMSANLPMITTMSPVTWNLDLPMPYTADRFYLDTGELRWFRPSFSSFDQYVETFYNSEKWSAYRQTLAEHDPMYSPLIMRSNLLDHSALVRLVRRAYGQRVIRSARRHALDQAGYNPLSEPILLAQGIVRDFARQARSDGMLPVVYLVNNLGYSDYLFQAIRPTLEADDIPCLSSHTIAASNNPRMYLPDSHFIEQIDDQLARALVAIIERGRSAVGCTPPLP